MALKNYEDLDEEDFYGQNFERPGFVSLWGSEVPLTAFPDRIDFLQDECGVGYYNLDDQELVCFRNSPAETVNQFSYASSFESKIVSSIEKAFPGGFEWLLAQYEFEYDPILVKRKIGNRVLFLGSFPFNTGNQ